MQALKLHETEPNLEPINESQKENEDHKQTVFIRYFKWTSWDITLHKIGSSIPSHTVSEWFLTLNQQSPLNLSS